LHPGLNILLNQSNSDLQFMTSLLPQKLTYLTQSQSWVLNCSIYAKIQTKLIPGDQTDGRSA